MNPMHRMEHDHDHDGPEPRFGPGERGRRGPHRGGPRRGGPHPGGFGRRGPDFGEAFLGPFDGPGFRRGRGRGPGRGQRGDVRNAVLALLIEQPMNGYQIITAIAERTEGLWRPSAGSVYPALGLLQDEGLIRPVDADGKKAFELTEEGSAYAAEHAEELTEPWAKVARPHEGYLDVRAEVGQLAMALQQVVHAGDADQIRAARAVLGDARRSLYRILAGDSPEQG